MRGSLDDPIIVHGKETTVARHMAGKNPDSLASNYQFYYIERGDPRRKKDQWRHNSLNEMVVDRLDLQRKEGGLP
jgi:hypothetical protein